MSSPVAAAPVPESAPLSEGARIVNTYIAPTKTFTDLQRNTAWWGPWLLIAIVSLGFVVVQKQIGFEQIAKNEIAKSPKTAERFEKLTPEQRAQQMGPVVTITAVFSYASPVLVLVIFLIMAAVLMATFNFGAGAAVPFKRAFAIVSYGSLPGVIHGLLGIVSLLAGVEKEGFNVQNPVASNPAYFMDATGSKFAYGMASALDLFSLWTVVLLGMGFACNSKVKRSTAMGIVLGWFFFIKLAGAGWAALMS